jgi:hypothetical protein
MDGPKQRPNYRCGFCGEGVACEDGYCNVYQICLECAMDDQFVPGDASQTAESAPPTGEDRFRKVGVEFCTCGHLNIEHYGAADWQTNPKCNYICGMAGCECKRFTAEAVAQTAESTPPTKHWQNLWRQLSSPFREEAVCKSIADLMGQGYVKDAVRVLEDYSNVSTYAEAEGSGGQISAAPPTAEEFYMTYTPQNALDPRNPKPFILEFAEAYGAAQTRPEEACPTCKSNLRDFKLRKYADPKNITTCDDPWHSPAPAPQTEKEPK